MSAPETEVVFTRDGEEILRRRLAPGAYIIGRWHECDLHVIADLVSRRHARLIVEKDQVFLEDLGSSNGTFIDGQLTAGLTLLPAGSRAQLGVLTLELPQRVLTPAETLAELLPDEFLRGQKYDVGPMIAQGGMGAIHDVREATIRRSVAMKLMLTEGAPDDLRRFIEEAQITGQLEHPNIVPVHELGLDAEGKLFYTMKLVRGITLLKILQLLGQGVAETVQKYPLAELLTVFQKVCDALAFAHSKGVIHRDLKPENVMIARYGEVLVMDWGIAKLVAPTGAPNDAPPQRDVNVKSGIIPSPARARSRSATASGAILGTPGFMSPEQARGEVASLDARSDVFALGAILYTILTLEFPFDGANFDEILDAVKTARPIPPAQRVLGTAKSSAKTKNGAPAIAPKGKPHLPGGRVPEALSAITMKALALHRGDRYQTVEELQADLAAWQGGFATRAEHAGVGRQVWLLIQRNRALAACAAVFFVLINTFGLTVLISQHRMAATLAQLRATAPTFEAQARTLVAEGRLDEAVEKIAFALELAPENAGYHLFRANTLEAAQRLGEAAAGYRKVLALKRDDESAQKNLDLCTQLLAENGGDGALQRATKEHLATQLVAQGRRIEAATLMAELGTADAGSEPAIRARIKEYSIQPGWSDARLSHLPTGGFLLDLHKLQIGDLGRLQGLPIAELNLDEAGLESLDGVGKLHGLTSLIVSDTKVTDLAPLRGLKLTRITLDNTKVTDLAPLTRMPLERLSMNNVRVTDLGPIRGAPLRSVHASGTPIADLTILAAPTLQTLFLNSTRVTDLRPLQGHQSLKTLALEHCAGIFDVTPLATVANLAQLHLPRQAIDCGALRPLTKLQQIAMDGRTAGLIPATDFWSQVFPTFAKAGPVRTALQRLCTKPLAPGAVEQNDEGQLIINLTGVTLADLSALRGQPVRALYASQSNVWDLSPLAGAPLAIVHLHKTGFMDCRMLAGFPDLEEVILPPKPHYLETLRPLAKLRYLSHEWNDDAKRPATTAQEYWAEWEAQRR